MTVAKEYESVAEARRPHPAQRILVLALIGVLMLLPLWFYPVLLMKLMCFALFASAFNLLLGYGGLLSFGHAAFFGGAAYFTAHALKVWEVNPEVAILAGVGGALVLGLVIGLLAVRRQGIYFAMVTLALSQMFYFFCLQAPSPKARTAFRAFPAENCSGSSTSPTARRSTTSSRWSSWPVSSRSGASCIRPTG